MTAFETMSQLAMAFVAFVTIVLRADSDVRSLNVPVASLIALEVAGGNRGGKYARNGAYIGGGLGLGVGVAVAASEYGVGAGITTALGAALYGAGIGFLIGVPFQDCEEVPLTRDVSITPIRDGKLALGVAFPF